MSADRRSLLLALILLLATAGALVLLSAQRTGGRVVYVLDDSYIHMAMAKHAAEHGIWGVTPYEFSSSSSSPLWTALLGSAFAVAGPLDALPFLLALLVAAGTLVLADRLWQSLGIGPGVRFVGLVALVFLTPLVPIVFTGLEHILHLGLTIAFAVEVAGILVHPDGQRGRSAAAALALAPCVAAVRYEGLFLISLAALLSFLRGRRGLAVQILALGSLPIVLYGVWSSLEGWSFLPNPVLLKGALPPLRNPQGLLEFLILGVPRHLAQRPHLALLAFAVTALLMRNLRAGRRLADPVTWTAFLFAGTLLLHLQFARTGSFYRYELYLVGFGIFVAIAALARGSAPGTVPLSTGTSGTAGRRGRAAAWATVLAVACIPLAMRGLGALTLVPRASANIYRQQIQMGLFLREFYSGQAVALNDIGAANFLADLRCLDVWGLGSQDLGQPGRRRAETRQAVEQAARRRDVAIAVLYEDWWLLKDGLPQSWVKLGEWTIPDNVVCGDATVSWFAVRPGEEPVLRDRLRRFAARLPRAVTQRGDYLRPEPVSSRPAVPDPAIETPSRIAPPHGRSSRRKERIVASTGGSTSTTSTEAGRSRSFSR